MDEFLFNGNDLKNISDEDLSRVVEHDIVLIGQKHFGSIFNADSFFTFGYDVEKMCRVLSDIKTHFEIKLPAYQTIPYKRVPQSDGELKIIWVIDGLPNIRISFFISYVLTRLQHPEYDWSIFFWKIPQGN